MYEENNQAKESGAETTAKKDGVSINLKINKETLKIGVLVALIVVSGVQAFQLSGLKGGTVKAAKQSAPATQASSGSGGGSALPASLQNLPSQVGGC